MCVCVYWNDADGGIGERIKSVDWRKIETNNKRREKGNDEAKEYKDEEQTAKFAKDERKEEEEE